MEPISPTLFWIGLAVSAFLVFRLYTIGMKYLHAGLQQYQFTQGAAALCQAVSRESNAYVAMVCNQSIRLSREGLSEEERLAIMADLAVITHKFSGALKTANGALDNLVKISDVVVDDKGKVLTPEEAQKYVVEKYRNTFQD